MTDQKEALPHEVGQCFWGDCGKKAIWEDEMGWKWCSDHVGDGRESHSDDKVFVWAIGELPIIWYKDGWGWEDCTIAFTCGRCGEQVQLDSQDDEPGECDCGKWQLRTEIQYEANE